MKKEKREKIKLFAIGGPTASGKTEAALILAKEFNGAIISCDSRQVYKELDVSTDKIPCELPYRDPINYRGIDHYGINIAEISQSFTLYDWQKYAYAVIEKIVEQGKLPMLVGGTGLYIQAVIENYDLSDDFDEGLRTKLNQLTLSELQTKLSELDSESYKKIDTNNPRRLIRAIEKSQKSEIDTKSANNATEKRYDALVLSFNPDRELIREKIRRRVKQHQELGVIDEVKRLVDKYGSNNEILNTTISVQEYIPYILGKISLTEAQERVVINNRRYAKRQMTWFKKYGDTVFCDSIEDMRQSVKQWL